MKFPADLLTFTAEILNEKLIFVVQFRITLMIYNFSQLSAFFVVNAPFYCLQLTLLLVFNLERTLFFCFYTDLEQTFY